MVKKKGRYPVLLLAAGILCTGLLIHTYPPGLGRRSSGSSQGAGGEEKEAEGPVRGTGTANDGLQLLAFYGDGSFQVYTYESQ